MTFDITEINYVRMYENIVPITHVISIRFWSQNQVLQLHNIICTVAIPDKRHAPGGAATMLNFLGGWTSGLLKVRLSTSG
jgi:hypothetical protein